MRCKAAVAAEEGCEAPNRILSSPVFLTLTSSRIISCNSARMSCESHSDALSELPSSESVIWQTLLTNPNQQEVRLDEIIAVLQRLMNGLMKAKAVELMVQSFVTSNGLVRLPFFRPTRRDQKNKE